MVQAVQEHPGKLLSEGEFREVTGQLRSRPTADKQIPYESGITPLGNARERFSVVPHAEVVGVDGAKHLWVGDAETVLDAIVQRVAPDVEVPLPREWDGPMETADTSSYADRTTAAFKDAPGSD